MVGELRSGEKGDCHSFPNMPRPFRVAISEPEGFLLPVAAGSRAAPTYASADSSRFDGPEWQSRRRDADSLFRWTDV